MIAGTLERGQTMASNYLVSLDPDNQQPWSRHSVPTDSHVMIDVIPGLLPGKRGPGIFSLYRIQPEGASSAEAVYTGTQVRFKGFNELINIAPTLDKLGGTARSISTSINASGYAPPRLVVFVADLFLSGIPIFSSLEVRESGTGPALYWTASPRINSSEVMTSAKLSPTNRIARSPSLPRA